jgi:uncharacterized protein
MADDHQQMPCQELALRFSCGDEKLIGILSLPRTPGPRGVLIVTGGPQYRAGSHRQFTLLARRLAAQGFPVLRFDYRGMGDSEGQVRDYRSITGDIDSALLQFFHSVPALREVILWGLCDGATAAACHAPRDARITGLVLLNPWVRSPASLARTSLRHYYLRRLGQWDFWRKLAGGGLHWAASLARLRATAADAALTEAELPQAELYHALCQFQGKVFVILSGEDLGAREWDELIKTSSAWRTLASSPPWQHVHIAGANHTFASAAWRAQVEHACLAWMRPC